MIVGASVSGLATAEALRRFGYRAEIVLVGDEPRRPHDRSALSEQSRTGEWGGDRQSRVERRQFEALNLNLRLGVIATGLDSQARVVRTTDGDEPYDGLVIATGARPRCPPGIRDLLGVHTLRTYADAAALRAALRPRQRLVVVGAGFRCSEIAAAASEFGADVMLVQSVLPVADTADTGVGNAIESLLARGHRDHGIDVRTDTAFAAVTSAYDRVTGVRLADGTLVPAFDVCFAIGSASNVAWLAGSGLSLDDGVVCDEYCAAAPSVYAVGDVATWRNPLFGARMRIEQRAHAVEQGVTVAYNLLSPDQPSVFAPVPHFSSYLYGKTVQTYGYLGHHDEAVVVEDQSNPHHFLVAYRTGKRLTGVFAVGIAPETLDKWRRLIGAATVWADITNVFTAPGRR